MAASREHGLTETGARGGTRTHKGSPPSAPKTDAEAIANELERASGFLHVTDERLIASVNVDEREEETFLVTSEEGTRSVFVSIDDDEDDPDRAN